MLPALFFFPMLLAVKNASARTNPLPPPMTHNAQRTHAPTTHTHTHMNTFWGWHAHTRHAPLAWQPATGNARAGWQEGVSVRVDMHATPHTRACARTRTRACTRTHIHEHTHMHMRAHAHTRPRMHARQNHEHVHARPDHHPARRRHPCPPAARVAVALGNGGHPCAVDGQPPCSRSRTVLRANRVGARPWQRSPVARGRSTLDPGSAAPCPGVARLSFPLASRVDGRTTAKSRPGSTAVAGPRALSLVPAPAQDLPGLAGLGLRASDPSTRRSRDPAGPRPGTGKVARPSGPCFEPTPWPLDPGSAAPCPGVARLPFPLASRVDGRTTAKSRPGSTAVAGPRALSLVPVPAQDLRDWLDSGSGRATLRPEGRGTLAGPRPGAGKVARPTGSLDRRPWDCEGRGTVPGQAPARSLAPRGRWTVASGTAVLAAAFGTLGPGNDGRPRRRDVQVGRGLRAAQHCRRRDLLRGIER